MNDRLKQEITDAILKPKEMEGWCSADKALAMADLILKTKPMTVVEIGVFGGRSLVPQGMALRETGQGRIYGIDPWKKTVAIEGCNSKENDEWWLKLDLEAIHVSCIENIWKHNLDDWCAVLRCTSQSACTLFDAIDILHIDGAHSEVSSVRDVVNYLPRVNHGGYIWFDDTDWPTTARAVRMVEEYCEKITSIGTCNLYQKKGGS